MAGARCGWHGNRLEALRATTTPIVDDEEIELPLRGHGKRGEGCIVLRAWDRQVAHHGNGLTRRRGVDAAERSAIEMQRHKT